MIAQRWHLILGVALFALVPAVRGQRSSEWRSFKFFDGLPESACRSIFVTPPGRVVLGHVNVPLLTEFDGYTCTTSPAPATTLGRICQSPSGQFWSLAPEGLQELREGRWVVHPVREIAEVLRTQAGQAGRFPPIYPVKQDRVIFLLPDRLLEFILEPSGQSRLVELRSSAKLVLGTFGGFTVAPDGAVWLACERGVAKSIEPARNLLPDGEWRDYPAPESFPAGKLREPLADGAGGVVMLGENSSNAQPVIVTFDGQHWMTRSVPVENIQMAWRGLDKGLWADSTDALFEWDESQVLATNEDVVASQLNDVSVEGEGVFWLATVDGLYRHTPALWRKPVGAREVNSPATGLTPDAAGRLWFLANNRLHALTDEGCRDYVLPSPFRSPASGRPMLQLKDGALLLDAGDRLLKFDCESGTFRPGPEHDASRRIRLLGSFPDGNLCVQTFAGKPRLEVFDGRVFQPVSEQRSLEMNERVSAFFAAHGGDLWLGSESGLAWWHDKKWRRFNGQDRTAPVQAVCFAELADGRIWCGTQREIWQFDGREWSLLRAGFDRINSVYPARDGSVWVASNNGLLRYVHGSWLENSELEGLPDVSIREVCGDSRGRIWAATPRGLSLYHPEADPDPPHTSILTLAESQASIPEGGVAELAFNGNDRWKHTPRHRLLYSYRLDERDWSTFQDAMTVSFSGLAPGKHFFQVRAMDRNANIDPAPPILEFTVALPWYREARLVLIAMLGLAAALFFAAVAINRHWRLRRSYAEVERKVAERTRQLEVANRELLHSQKMNALGTLAAGIAHDFNNILSIVKGSAQIIEDNLENPQKIRTRVDRIKTVVEQGSGIVKAMLGFSRDSSGEPALCNPNDVVADTIRLLGDRFLREVTVKFSPASDLPAIQASKDFVQQILLNFIFNAAEAMDGNKQIFLTTEHLRALPNDLVLAPAAAAEYVGLGVRDSGCGIPPENLSRIFEPFFTTKALSTRRGTGLGLSMAYELAKKLGAGLAVESRVGEGSTFTLIIPLRHA